MGLAKINQDDSASLRELVEAGRVKLIIDRRCSLEQTAQAISYLQEGHPRGKVVISIENPTDNNGTGGTPP